MATTQQGRDFGWEFFDQIIEWIKGYLDPGDVFDEKDLREWAGINCNLEDVFDKEYLIDWAETNGYIKETEE